MDNFTFYSPTYFVFGKDEEKRAGGLVKRFGGSRVLIHYGGGSVVRSGLLDRVKKSLDEAGLYYTELGGVKPNPRSGLVYEGIDLCRKEKIDFVLAVGGGSTIDSSKAIAAGTVYDGDFWDFYSGKLVEKALPIGTILTIAAAGSEGSPDSVITNENGMFKRGATGGITDIMAHLMERYLTNTKDVVTTDRMIEALMLAMIEEGPKAVQNPQDYEARANIMWAGMMAHNNSCGVGRSQDWNSHNIEHELSALYDCAHGAGLAVTFPAYLGYVYKHDVDRVAQLAVRVWDCKDDPDNREAVALEGIEKLRAFSKSIGMPVTLGELGGKEEDIPKLADVCCNGDGRDGFLYGFDKLSEEDVANIYRQMI